MVIKLFFHVYNTYLINVSVLEVVLNIFLTTSAVLHETHMNELPPFKPAPEKCSVMVRLVFSVSKSP